MKYSLTAVEEGVVAFTLRFGNEVRYPNGNPAFVLTNNYTHQLTI